MRSRVWYLEREEERRIVLELYPQNDEEYGALLQIVTQMKRLDIIVEKVYDPKYSSWGWRVLFYPIDKSDLDEDLKFFRLFGPLELDAY